MTREAVEWETAGFYTEDGQIDRPLPISRLLIPAVIELQDGELRWAPVVGERRSHHVALQEGILERFVTLADASDKDVLRYARRWGMLLLCKHNLPSSHNQPKCLPIGSNDFAKKKGGAWYWGREPVAVWRQFSRKARAILNVAANLDKGRGGAVEDWRAIYDERSDRVARRWKPGDDTQAHRLMLARALNEWLTIANVRPALEWGRAAQRRPRICLAEANPAWTSGIGLFGAIATQLVFAIARSDGLEMCSGCGEPFIPNRRPREGQRRYCRSCRSRGVPLRDAQRDRRRRKAR
jgi:hypothetical protein